MIGPLYIPHSINLFFQGLVLITPPFENSFGLIPDHYPTPRRFRFEKFWLTNSQLPTLIQGWWNALNPEGCGAFILSKNLAFLKNKLRNWAKITFSNPNLQKTLLLSELLSLDTIGESRPLSSVKSSRALNIRQELFSILNQEEIY